MLADIDCRAAARSIAGSPRETIPRKPEITRGYRQSMSLDHVLLYTLRNANEHDRHLIVPEFDLCYKIVLMQAFI